MLAETQTVFADAKVYQQTLKSTTWIIAKAENGYSTGSGVLVDAEKKWVVTNFHAAGASTEVLVFFPQFEEGQLIAERQYYIEGADDFGIRGRVVMVDKKRDLAIVENSTRFRKTPPPLKSPKHQTALQKWCIQSGNPTAGGVLWTYTSGAVRSVYRKQFHTQAGEHEMRVVETQSPINPGDNGGPVLNT